MTVTIRLALIAVLQWTFMDMMKTEFFHQVKAIGNVRVVVIK